MLTAGTDFDKKKEGKMGSDTSYYCVGKYLFSKPYLDSEVRVSRMERKHFLST